MGSLRIVIPGKFELEFFFFGTNDFALTTHLAKVIIKWIQNKKIKLKLNTKLFLSSDKK